MFEHVQGYRVKCNGGDCDELLSSGVFAIELANGCVSTLTALDNSVETIAVLAKERKWARVTDRINPADDLYFCPRCTQNCIILPKEEEKEQCPPQS